MTFFFLPRSVRFPFFVDMSFSCLSIPLFQKEYRGREFPPPPCLSPHTVCVVSSVESSVVVVHISVVVASFVDAIVVGLVAAFFLRVLLFLLWMLLHFF